MKINTLTTKELNSTLKPFPFSLNESTAPANGMTSSTRTSLRRLRSETTSITTIESQENLSEKFMELEADLQRALSKGKFEKALKITDELITLSNDLGFDGFYTLPKVICLKNLGRLDDAYDCISKRLSEVSLSDDWENEYKNKFKDGALKNFKENRSYFPDYSTISYEKFIDEQFKNMLPLFKAFYEVNKQERRELLIERALITLQTEKREFAIHDLREAGFMNVDYKYNQNENPEFFLRCLEKKLDETFMFFKDHKKIVNELSKKTVLTDEEQYELLMSFALSGKEKEALEAYNKIVDTDEFDFPEETAFLLAWLRKDVNSVMTELENANWEYKGRLEALLSN